MTSVGYTTVALTHLSGLLAFHYTGIAWILLLPAAQSLFSIFIFLFAVSAILGSSSTKTNFEPETEYLGIRFLSQLASLLTAYQVYLLGYELLSGIMITVACCMILTLIFISFEKKA
jgi:hypothetical protein